MTGHLDHKHELLLESLLTGSLPRSLRWDDVVELIGKLGKIEPHGGNKFEFVVGSQRALFERPSAHILEIDEASRLRRLLRNSDVAVARGKPAHGVHLVVVIDHHLARIYRDVDASEPESEKAVRPYDPHGFHRHLIHRKEAHYQGERVPEESSFYEEVAKDLVPAEEIVLIGHGTGKSSALEALVECLKKHHPAIDQHVTATEVADLSALSEAEIEEIARKHI